MNLRLSLTSVITSGCLLLGIASAHAYAPAETNAPPTILQTSPEDAVILPSGLNDPIEPFNRAMWSFNKGVLTSVVKPFSRGYRFVVVKPLRTGIGNMGKNLTYPGRLVNNLLQGNWAGVGNETGRVVCNTVIGLGGFFDVATKWWNIPKSDTDFGHTFQKWGWNPGFFIMLPVFGPNDKRDTVGLVGDVFDEPQTYFYPYEYINSGVTLNNFTDNAEAAVYFSQSQADPYSLLQYAWSFAHENRKVDLRLNGKQDEATLETLQAVFCTYKDPEFPTHGKTKSVLIPSTGKKLDFTYWLQSGNAPVVYLVPGLGAHRFAGNQLALAELLYDHGFSAVSISSSLHPEFMQNASTTDLPSYPPIDAHDVHVALTEIDRSLEKTYPHCLGAKALMGYSMGAFQTLFLAAQAATNNTPLLKFDRYVAIDSPVRLRYAVTNVDNLYNAALAWPTAERTAHIENTLLKVVALSTLSSEQNTNLPFNAIESKFLIGLSFRLTLRDVIFDSQLRHNQGILKQPLKTSKRWPAYNEIMQYSLLQYIEQFAAPYDKSRGIDLKEEAVADLGTDLRGSAASLRGNRDVRVIANRNDLFVNSDDIAWLESTFGSERLTIFEHGGHTGNLSQPEVQKAVLKALDGLIKKPTTSATARRP
jgi:ABC-type transporter lipoprotein component MlaA/pimeloyl-ACP methyl ester carboxylesterase